MAASSEILILGPSCVPGFEYVWPVKKANVDLQN